MKPLHKLWPEMEALVDNGYTKSIGVSNMNTQLIWDLLTYARIKPVVNQVEINPQNAQTELIRFLIANDIRPVAYTPVCRYGHEKSHDFTQEDLMKTLAAKYNKSVPQIMLNWGVSRGCVVIPKATSLEHQVENS
jgi:diketogulonate reductase-like aldo/keto reductase